MNGVAALIGWAVTLQSLEQIWLRRSLNGLDPWDSGRIANSIHAVALGFSLLGALATIFHPHPAFTLVMIVSTYLTAVRFHGTFNGGSDTLTLHVLVAVFVAQLWPPYENAFLIYIAVFVSLSYFVAGAAKLFSAPWRSGVALPRFLLFSNAAFPNRFTPAIRQHPEWARSWSRVVIAWEILFPLSLLAPAAAWIFLSMGLVFHLLNFYFFGLNRFVWAWLATYPAILSVSGHGICC